MAKRRRVEAENDVFFGSTAADTIAYSPFSSPIWTLAAGESTFDVHAGKLVKSPKFQAQVEGRWRESKDRRIDLNWDPSTVAQLVKWLYEKDYDCPYPVNGLGDWLDEPCTLGKVMRRRDHEQQVRRRPPGAAWDIQYPESVSSFYSNGRYNDDPYPRDPRDLPSARMAHPYPRDIRDSPLSRVGDPRRCDVRELPPIRDEISCDFLRKLVPKSQLPETEGSKYEDWCETIDDKLGSKLDISVCDFGPILTRHAEVYALANYALLQDLKDLAYQRLGTTLLFLQSRRLDEAVTVHVADLARCVYDKTDDSSANPDPMRHLVSSFIAMNMSQSRFVGAEIDSLMSEGGPCAVDISKNLCKEIGDEERRIYRKEALEMLQATNSSCRSGSSINYSAHERGSRWR